MTKKTTLAEVIRRFAAKGKTLLSTEYKDNKTKLQYRCQCGKEDCWMSLNVLDKGTDSCIECSKTKRANTLIQIYGVPHLSQSAEVQATKRANCMIKYGVSNCMQDPGVQAKKSATMLERYGVENPSQVPEFQEKKRKTWLVNYGVDHPFKSVEILAKRTATWLLNHGVDNPSKSELCRKNVRLTNQERFGVSNPSQSSEVQAKKVATCQARYGVDHHMQVPEIFAKVQATAFGRKPYIFPSGEVIQVQGYEHCCYDDLLINGCSEEELLAGYYERPVIFYSFEGKQHAYYPDILIASCNAIIEVKSRFTYNLAIAKTQAKMKACLEQGYLPEVWIYDKKGQIEEVLTFVED